MKVVEYYTKYPNSTLAKDDKGVSVKYTDIPLMANWFSEFEISRNLIFQICTNTIGSLLGYCAFQLLNSVNLLLSEHINKEQLENLMNIYQPNYLWLPEEYEIEGIILDKKYGYKLIKTSFQKCHQFHLEISLLLSTSGSTGTAKLVKLSNNNLLSNAESIAEYLHLNSKEKPITSLPMNYSYGLSVINSHILRGATLLLTDKSVIQKEFWEFFKNEGGTSISGVPYTYELLSRLRFERMNLPSLRTMTQAGGKLSKDLVSHFYEISKNKGFKFVVMYGQTEATARISYVPVEKLKDKIGSIGVAIPNGRLDIFDENHKPVKGFNIEGELTYWGDNVFGGYAENLEDLKTFEKLLPLYTGDIAYKDEDGYFFITGRKKRFVKLFGNRISLDAVEQILKKYIPEVACVGNDSVINIFITKKPQIDIVAKLADKLHLFPSVIKVKEIDEIPKNESGKIQYSKLK